MGKYLISGGKKLCGEISVESAKNSVLPILAASTLTDEKVVIKCCPKIADVISLINILNSLGVETAFENENLIINSSGMNNYTIPERLSKELRASVFMLGALISRFKKAEISFPGGCNIGKRPIDLHLKSLKEMGVNSYIDNGFVKCSAEKILAKKITLSYPSVGATENLMLSAVLADGKTEIRNCAREPEIVDLMRFLNTMGAKIYGGGTSTILIDGVKKLHGTVYQPMSDRIEAGTFLIATAITGGELQLNNCNAKNICTLIHKLCDNTCKIAVKNDIIYMRSNGRGKSFNLHTGPYPDFPTDLQSQMAVLASVASGSSTITENVFERRFAYVDELNKMGADIRVKGRTAYVNGVLQLTGTKVRALDLRGGAALIIAGLNAEGITQVSGAEHILRGYLDLDKKFRSLGADIKLIDGD
ncbi:MAG: UDP-N-acetylglucosamine 1-carboxyvinyltransferase [Clostridiales bacterium]|nr:UDP-N-acetylglucosamine 1-carboxyvinyltransferase [Clostridiales bacterium]